MFEPNLRVGQVINNDELRNIFKCANMGGMRPSRKTNTLVLISDYTKGLYNDKWIDGVLHYVGMGRYGNQSPVFHANKYLAYPDLNPIDLHLFIVKDSGQYTYFGRVERVGEVYTERQKDAAGVERDVLVFPIRPVSNAVVDLNSLQVLQ